MRLDELKIDSIYSFNTYAPAILTPRIENAKLKLVTGTEFARRFEPIDQVYSRVFRSLPEGTPKSIDNRVWYVFTALNGSTIVMCDQWIVESTIEEIHTVSYRVFIPEMGLGKDTDILHALAGIGIHNAVVTTE